MSEVTSVQNTPLNGVEQRANAGNVNNGKSYLLKEPIQDSVFFGARVKARRAEVGKLQANLKNLSWAVIDITKKPTSRAKVPHDHHFVNVGTADALKGFGK